MKEEICEGNGVREGYMHSRREIAKLCKQSDDAKCETFVEKFRKG